MMDNNPRSRLSDLKYPEVVMSSALLSFTLMLVLMRSLVAISSEVAADSSIGALRAASFCYRLRARQYHLVWRCLLRIAWQLVRLEKSLI